MLLRWPPNSGRLHCGRHALLQQVQGLLHVVPELAQISDEDRAFLAKEGVLLLAVLHGERCVLRQDARGVRAHVEAAGSRSVLPPLFLFCLPCHALLMGLLVLDLLNEQVEHLHRPVELVLHRFVQYSQICGLVVDGFLLVPRASYTYPDWLRRRRRVVLRSLSRQLELLDCAFPDQVLDDEPFLRFGGAKRLYLPAETHQKLLQIGAEGNGGSLALLVSLVLGLVLLIQEDSFELHVEDLVDLPLRPLDLQVTLVLRAHPRHHVDCVAL